jgi:hypothetical protein
MMLRHVLLPVNLKWIQHSNVRCQTISIRRKMRHARSKPRTASAHRCERIS